MTTIVILLPTIVRKWRYFLNFEPEIREKERDCDKRRYISLQRYVLYTVTKYIL